MNATRAYSSTLREDQARRTRELIVDALVDQVCDSGRSDLSMSEVAERAGVSVRTVYRHFPTRDDLFAAINERLDEATIGSEPSQLSDLPRHVQHLLAWFEENPRLVEAFHVAGLGREVRRRGRKRRGELARQVIDESMADRPENERIRAWAVCRAFFGSHSWRTMRQELGLSAEQTLDAMKWVFGLMQADLERRRVEAKQGKRHE